MTTDERVISPSEDDPAALRVELSVEGMSARGVAIVATRKHKRPVRIVLSVAQAADLARRLQAVLVEI